jgi:hypothetical protein
VFYIRRTWLIVHRNRTPTHSKNTQATPALFCSCSCCCSQPDSLPSTDEFARPDLHTKDAPRPARARLAVSFTFPLSSLMPRVTFTSGWINRAMGGCAMARGSSSSGSYSQWEKARRVEQRAKDQAERRKEQERKTREREHAHAQAATRDITAIVADPWPSGGPSFPSPPRLTSRRSILARWLPETDPRMGGARTAAWAVLDVRWPAAIRNGRP